MAAVHRGGPVKTWIQTVAALGFITATLSVAGIASAFPISTQLTGDPRPFSPDNLIVDVSIAAVGNQATFTVDLNSPQHPNATLGGFFFNVDIPVGDVSLVSTVPAGWSLTSGTNAPGSGGASFNFQVSDAPGAPNNSVTNTINLIFTLQKSTGAWLDADFLNADQSCSNNAVLGCGQMGAHLLSLNTTGCIDCSISGFVLGATQVPEPSVMTILASGVFGLWILSRLRGHRNQPSASP